LFRGPPTREFLQDIATDLRFLEALVSSRTTVAFGGSKMCPGWKITAWTDGGSVSLEFPGDSAGISAETAGNFSEG